MKQLLLLCLIFAIGCANVEQKETAVSQKATSSGLLTLENRNVEFADLEGQEATLVIFWATWCPSCKKKIPQIKELQRDYSNNLSIVAISVGETIPVVTDFCKKHQIDYPVVVDLKGTFSKSWKIEGMPTVILRNKEKQEIYRGTNLPIGKIKQLVAKANVPQHTEKEEKSVAVDKESKSKMKMPFGKNCNNGVCPLPTTKN